MEATGRVLSGLGGAWFRFFQKFRVLGLRVWISRASRLPDLAVVRCRLLVEQLGEALVAQTASQRLRIVSLNPL